MGQSVHRTGASRHAEWRCGRRRGLAPVNSLHAFSATMAIVATLWLPSLDPVGSASVLAFIAAAVCWVLVELPALRRFQTQVIVGAAILFFGFMLVSSAPIIVHAPLYGFLMKVRRFPNLDDYLGNWIVMAVGLVLSLKLQRREHRGSVGLAVLFGLLIAGELAGQLYWRYAG